MIRRSGSIKIEPSVKFQCHYPGGNRFWTLEQFGEINCSILTVICSIFIFNKCHQKYVHCHQISLIKIQSFSIHFNKNKLLSFLLNFTKNTEFSLTLIFHSRNGFLILTGFWTFTGFWILIGFWILKWILIF